MMRKKSGIYELMLDLGDALQSQEEVYMLGGGNPAQIESMQQLFRQAMQSLLESDNDFDNMVGYYDGPQGSRLFCQQLAKLLNQHFNWNLSAENIAITNGSQSTFSALFQILLRSKEQADHILLPIIPEYIGYKDIRVHNKEIFKGHAPLIQQLDDPWLFKYNVDMDNLPIDSNTRAICLSRPTNPSGNVISDEQINQLNQLALKHQIPFIIDSAYGLPFPNILFNSASAIWNQNIILCLSLSKLGLPGVRTGIVIARPEIIEQISDFNATHALAPGSFGPALMLELFKQHDVIKVCNKHITPFYSARCKQAIDIIKKEFQGLPVQIHEPGGALFLWLWCKNLPITSDQLYQRLKARKVLVISGHHFFLGIDHIAHSTTIEQQRDSCIRVSYGAPIEKVEAGLRIIADELRQIYADSELMNAGNQSIKLS